MRSIAFFACALALSAGLLLANEINLRGTRNNTLKSVEANLTSHSIVLAREVDRSLKVLDLALSIVADRLRQLGAVDPDALRLIFGDVDTHLWLRERILGIPHVDAITIIDAKGHAVNTTRSWPSPGVVVDDRDYFLTLKSNPDLDILISEPVLSRVTGVRTVFMARRLNGAGGEFVGIAMGAISLAYIQSYFKSITPQDGSSALLMRDDGLLLAHYPEETNKSWTHALSAFLPDGRALEKRLFRLSDTEQGSDRIVSTRPLANYPLRIVMSQLEGPALREWKALARFSYVSAGGSAILIMFLTTAGIIWWRKQRKLNAVLAQQNVRFDTALDNMSAGLCMFDADKRLVVCNERYLQLYRLPPHLSRPGALHSDIIAYRLRNGLLRGETTEHTVDDELAALTGLPADSTFTRIDELADGRHICVTRRPMKGGGWVAIHEDISFRRKSEEKILHMARHDALTDLPNRSLLRERLDILLKATSRNGRSVAVLMLDLDRFKEVNDTLGHPVGDDLLKEVADRLRACTRETAMIARLGGDEFAIIEDVLDPLSESTALAERILVRLDEPFAIRGHQVLIGCSIGIAIGPVDGKEPDELMKNADLALYRVKSEGRGSHCYFEPEMDRRMQSRRDMERDLRAALASDQFELHFQPIVQAETGRITACEALLRWRHPQRGFVQPDAFIALAEETGLIQPIGEWVIRTACATAATWPADVAVAVNISGAQFRGNSLTPIIMNGLAQSGLSASRLEVEITESAMMEEGEATFSTLRQLHALGVRISLDDFGTGCSSLSHLRKFTFDKIKIDRSFVAELGDNTGTSHAIVHSLIQLARTLGKKTTAEGIETHELAVLAREVGCTELQGYHFSRPVPAAEFLQMLQSSTAMHANAA